MIVKLRKQLALVLFSLLWLPGVLPGQAVAASEFDTGLQLVERRSFRSALEYLNRALAESSLDTGQKAKMLLARGLSYKALLADTNAVMDFQEVLALDATSAEACYQLGMMYRSGRGVAKDSEKVLELMTRAANKDHIHAQRALAEHYFRKDHHDLSKSHFWLMKAANRGDSQAQLLLATRYAKGRGLIQNSKEAFKWYLRSAEEGEPVAQFEVAKSYRNGEPVEQDTQQATLWLERSARQGYVRAEFLYAELHASGEGVKKDLSVAAQWFWRAAEMGHNEARMRLAGQYLQGEGIEQNFAQAAHWFRRSGRKPLAQFHLGEIYEKGLGVEPDLKKAFSYYRRSAKERWIPAMLKTAMMYMTGTGVDENKSVAENYIRFVAGGGSPGTLNAAAWILATDENPQLRSGELALSLARQAMKKNSSYQFIDTLAAVHAEMGKFKKAVRSQKKALKQAGEDSVFRTEMERHLQAYLEKKPWRETYQLDKSHPVPVQAEAQETVFIGSIILLREAKGFRRKGIVLNNGAKHVIEILVQKVESGFLPRGQNEYLVIYLNNPTDFYTRIESVEGVLDYPLESIRFHLKENPVGGWHYELTMHLLKETTG